MIRSLFFMIFFGILYVHSAPSRHCVDQYPIRELYAKLYTDNLQLIENMQHFHSLHHTEQEKLKNYIVNAEAYVLDSNNYVETPINKDHNSTHYISDFFCQYDFRRKFAHDRSYYPRIISEAQLKQRYLFELQAKKKEAWACLPVHHLKFLMERNGRDTSGFCTYKVAFEVVIVSYKLALVQDIR